MLGMEGDITYSLARGRSVQPKKVEQIQHKKIKDNTQSHI